MIKIQLESLSDLEKAGKQFIQSINHHTVFAFNGEMGAGKTTFIKMVCTLLGVKENITSPTFAIINEYIAADEKPIYHFDCYRLKNMQEAFDLGAEEYFYSGNICFIEWPNKIEELLPNDAVWVDIKVLPNQDREIIIRN
ncbi:MAG: tRNA (adenosine(37)-N6)-threonylcarbamoyltransferase complex ATPase subunit type 1 TsaE [Prolixibacteraceae bacterium]|jgi:tRNA threonylcarbamoyladenosine biosynthesis protein TsaE|nr:tRNA (adenosine(37)-N6)-threonylcarbamoyltransferase complex ATPase subunit type 1 TsaE [Prolixibacteraceae bacterium]